MMRRQKMTFQHPRATTGRRTTERPSTQTQLQDWQRNIAFTNEGQPDPTQKITQLMGLSLPGKQNEEDQRSTHSPPTAPAHQESTATENGKLIQLLNTLMNRMDRLEDTLSNRSRPLRKEGNTIETVGRQEGRENHPEGTPKSINPDFTDLW